jgi:hypothetical protein
LIGRPPDVGSKPLRKHESLPLHLSPEPLSGALTCNYALAHLAGLR